MENIKIDLKDRRILEMLDINSNASLSEIAKNALISKQVADYRINKLTMQKTIYSFFTLVELGKLGHSLFRVHIKLKNVSEEEYSKFVKHLFEQYPTFWVAFVSGSFDIIVDIWAQHANDFDIVFNHILSKNKKIIYSYEIFPLLELVLYDYGYFLDKKVKRRKISLFKKDTFIEIDKTDEHILTAIKSNSRLSYEEIGRKVNLTRNTVKNRIKNLEKLGIIAGYKMMVDFKHFDRLSYKIFIKYDHSKIDQEKELLEFIQNKAGILASTKLLGKWNLDIEIQPKDAKELQKFIIELRSKFSLIESYELIQIIEDYGIDFYPDKVSLI
ncbi:Lrp/AsnC family transcriptional regulator [Candidatus Pacearchaeota archaeon]|nr:Lrp/AsnC family transcriptional regulator [Candidatus Pacearchaeota archaeon]